MSTSTAIICRYERGDLARRWRQRALALERAAAHARSVYDAAHVADLEAAAHDYLVAADELELEATA